MSKPQTRQCQKCGSQLPKVNAAELATRLEEVLVRIADRPHDPTEGYDQRREAEARADRMKLIAARNEIGVLRDQMRGYCGMCAPTLAATAASGQQPEPQQTGPWLAIAPYGARHIVLALADSRALAFSAGWRRADDLGIHVLIEPLEATAELVARVNNGTVDCRELGLWRDSSGWHLPGQGGSASAELERAVDQSTSRPAH